MTQTDSDSSASGAGPRAPRPGREGPRTGRAVAGVLTAAAVAAGVLALALLLHGGGGGDERGGGTGTLGHWEPTTRFLLAVAVIVTVCHATGAVVGRLGQPSVVGDILAGLLLGPTVLGALVPEVWEWLFREEIRGGLEMVAQLGLILFMFLVGTEFRAHRLRGRRAVLGTVSVAGLAVPFLCALPLAVPLYDDHGGDASFLGFSLFFGLAFSITALPVLAGILRHEGLLGTPTGTLAVAVAVVSDVAAWSGLAFILAAAGRGGAGEGGVTILLGALFTGLVLTAGRRGLARLARPGGPRRGSEYVLALMVVAAIAAALVTQLIGLHLVFGAFLAGTVMPKDGPVVEDLGKRLSGLTFTVLLPLFFAYLGTRTEIDTVFATPGRVLTFAAMLAVAISAKVVAVAGSARLAGLPGREAVPLGVLMNCRGLTELVIADIGLRAGLIDGYLFTAFVLVALVTTAVTTPLLHLAHRWSDRRRAPDAGPPLSEACP